MATIRIFIASSAELRHDRKDFRNFLAVENDRLHKKGNYLELVQWEHCLDAVSQTRLQDEYNDALKGSDIVICLFFSKAGKYTQEEFDTALTHFRDFNRPLIYTYFKTGAAKPKSTDEQGQDLIKFKKRLSDIGHFYTAYNNIDHLKLQFRKQLDILEDKGLIVLQEEVKQQTKVEIANYFKTENTVIGSTISAGRDVNIGSKVINIFHGKDLEYKNLARKIDELKDDLEDIPENKKEKKDRKIEELEIAERELTKFKKNMRMFYIDLKKEDKQAFDEIFGNNAINELDNFFEALKKVKEKEIALVAKHRIARRNHFDAYDKHLKSLEKEELFAQQQRDSLNYLSIFGLTVKSLKEKLYKLKYYNGMIDDNFDADTVNALTKFQEDNEMRHIDGMFGELTFQMLALRLEELEK